MNYLINQVIYDRTERSVGRKRKHGRLPALLMCLVAFGCATVPHTGRKQLNVVSDSQLNTLAIKAFDEVASKEPESKDKGFNEIVRRVTDRVSQAAEKVDHPRFDWKVRVIDKDVPNAVCLPGGKIVVFTGLRPYLKNEAGLAAVISHEVAHAVARHGGERLSQQLAMRGAVSAGGEILKNKDGSLDTKSRIALGALGLGGTLGVILPYSRVHEFEADRIGLIYMARAGYDPSEAVRLWERMSKIKKPPIPVWLSTHPADEDRISKMKELLPEAEKLYRSAGQKCGLGEAL
ncbi:MAG: M48 family metallopeptidase [Desulfomonile tiedjei]|nr:M48 family metallopeptidase [Desulfomonile tiedjei]